MDQRDLGGYAELGYYVATHRNWGMNEEHDRTFELFCKAFLLSQRAKEL